ncbi:Tol-Pal system protein TolQ [Myxococcaceae bacterium]|nr:Tol-Pal system protein TolQ [Myxococcaceae bacterium]
MSFPGGWPSKTTVCEMKRWRCLSFGFLRLGLALLLLPGLALAWFNDGWASRKQVAVDAGLTGADTQETLADFPLLVRLHAGNFAYFADLAEGGKDIRFMADDKTPLRHAAEKVDAASQIALLWVRLPSVRGGNSTDSFWMYYGNAAAEDGSDAAGVWDTAQALVLHFAEGQALPQDATAYGNHAFESKATVEPGGWIGAAARFDGRGGIGIKPAPSLAVSPEGGFSFSAWLKFDSPQGTAKLFEAADGKSGLGLSLNGQALTARYQGAAAVAQTPAANLQPGKWQHVAVVARKDRLELYVDGAKAVDAPINLVAFSPGLTVGTGLNGLLDEVQVSNKARSADWIKLSFRSQSPDFQVLSFGQDEGKSQGGNIQYFTIILQSLTVEGWAVIALCGVMLVISLIVMITKGLALSRAKKDNRAFLEQYRNMETADPGALDQEETEEEKEFADSDFLAAVAGRHDHFQSSPLYHVYHAGVQELRKRYGNSLDRPLTPRALDVLRARLDAAAVREGQRLNKNMVLLTIAISGGPFLGLLGTVLGVMITFAVIAATGDVNINAIAPGISGALLATVAGLAVAIPALFAYNYLLTQIKDITADMRVFTDEFLALVAERAAGGGNGPSPPAPILLGERGDKSPSPVGEGLG